MTFVLARLVWAITSGCLVLSLLLFRVLLSFSKLIKIDVENIIMLNKEINSSLTIMFNSPLIMRWHISYVCLFSFQCTFYVLLGICIGTRLMAHLQIQLEDIPPHSTQGVRLIASKALAQKLMPLLTEP